MSPGDAERLFCVAFSRPRAQMVVMGVDAELESNPTLWALCRGGHPWAPSWPERRRVRVVT